MSKWIDTLIACVLATLLTACGGVNSDTSNATSKSSNKTVKFTDNAADDLQNIKHVSGCPEQPGSCQPGVRSYRF